MEKEMLIPVILGTAREGRESEAAAKYVLSRVKAQGVHSVLVDVRDYSTSETYGSSDVSPITEAWKATMRQADGLVVVVPEYNHGYPGELKIVLDALFEEYDRKPVSICGVSSGGLGGARAVEQLRNVFVALGMVPTRQAVYFSNVNRLFTGPAISEPDVYDARTDKMLEELLWYARALKKAREAKE